MNKRTISDLLTALKVPCSFGWLGDAGPAIKVPTLGMQLLPLDDNEDVAFAESVARQYHAKQGSLKNWSESTLPSFDSSIRPFEQERGDP